MGDRKDRKARLGGHGSNSKPKKSATTFFEKGGVRTVVAGGVGASLLLWRSRARDRQHSYSGSAVQRATVEIRSLRVTGFVR